MRNDEYLQEHGGVRRHQPLLMTSLGPSTFELDDTVDSRSPTPILLESKHMSNLERSAVKAELDRLTLEFFDAVSFEPGGAPSYGSISALFIERGLLIKNVSATPEISSVREFIEPREALVSSGTLTRFHESEISESTVIFGNVAHRFSVYAKSGTASGKPFQARGMITTQFVNTQSGWKMSAMAWDDERPGLSIADSTESICS